MCRQLADDAGSNAIPLIHMVVTFAYFTVVQKKELSASIVFSAISGFGMLRWALFSFMSSVPALIQAKVSVGRVQEFLNDVRAPISAANTYLLII